ncbi:Dabb family protein [Microbacterium atlanticum]|uniref:Dabb family protein n=1 Tax=Microbacterium atlanticum TaxID=2782168 RepID=UPI001E34C112|nr:Dabb family protein [Microbacterium atlanticum]
MLFRIHDEVPEQDIEGAQRALRALAAFPGVVEWRVERSLDSRKGTILIEDATFSDRKAFETFRICPEHEAAASQMSAISDWWIGDYHSGGA